MATTVEELQATIREAGQAVTDMIGALHDMGCDSDNYADGCKGCQVLRVLKSEPRLKALNGGNESKGETT